MSLSRTDRTGSSSSPNLNPLSESDVKQRYSFKRVLEKTQPHVAFKSSGDELLIFDHDGAADSEWILNIIGPDTLRVQVRTFDKDAQQKLEVPPDTVLELRGGELGAQAFIKPYLNGPDKNRFVSSYGDITIPEPIPDYFLSYGISDDTDGIINSQTHHTIFHALPTTITVTSPRATKTSGQHWWVEVSEGIKITRFVIGSPERWTLDTNYSGDGKRYLSPQLGADAPNVSAPITFTIEATAS